MAGLSHSYMARGAQTADRAGSGLGDEALGAERLALEQREGRPRGVGGAAIDRRTGGRHAFGEGGSEPCQEVALREDIMCRKWCDW